MLPYTAVGKNEDVEFILRSRTFVSAVFNEVSSSPLYESVAAPGFVLPLGPFFEKSDIKVTVTASNINTKSTGSFQYIFVDNDLTNL